MNRYSDASISNLFFRNPRLTVLSIALILVGGLSSYYVLPRMEDPLLTERVAMITTRFPGADAERVESLVTEKIERELQGIEEIKEIRSRSRSGVSTVNIELRDETVDVDPVWSRIRDKLDDATPEFPNGVLQPEFEQLEVKAYATIVALVWNASDKSQANFAILRRLAEQLDDELRAISGTEEVDTFGDPDEEILVEVDQSVLAALGLSASAVSDQIRASDAKVSAGRVRASEDLMLEVGGELRSLDRIRQIPIQYRDDGKFVRLSDVASVQKGIAEPPSSLAIVRGKPAIALGVLVRPSVRIDHWTRDTQDVLEAFAHSLPRGVELETVFEQNRYVETRLAGLRNNLLLGGLAVVAVIFVMMGRRSALIVGAALPLAAMMVLTGMRFLDIPIHQMSVTGLIIALGLLIDNAIVIVDEVNGRLQRGDAAGDAVSRSVRHLSLPLFGSTITTALAFAPIALMPGPAGEFVGSIAVSVILAIFSSLLLALTIVPALAAGSRRLGDVSRHGRSSGHWWQDGLRLPGMLPAYQNTLQRIFAWPVLGIALGLVLPVAGFIQFAKLPEQFFPPADRDQFQIEVELPSTSSLGETLATVQRMRDRVRQNDRVEEVSWFLGQSAPSFYYNVIPRRRETSNYAQALVQLHRGQQPLPVIQQLQRELSAEFPTSRVLVRQLEQGPPFDAPVEVRLFGPDLQMLRELGDQISKIMSGVPNVVHIRSDLSDTVAKLSLDIDEEEARLAGLDHRSIANQLSATLEGAVGGSILEETEELPVRVRVANDTRARLGSIASMEVLGSDLGSTMDGAARQRRVGVPISALGNVTLMPQSANIPRLDCRRMNEVQVYITAGVLPATVLDEFQRRLSAADFRLPPGYAIKFGGESAKRNDAIGNLMANVGMLMVLMVATLVLSFRSFRIAGIIGVVAVASAGLAVGALWLFDYPFGFMAIVGTMGLVGVAINDTIVVLAAIRDDSSARRGDPRAVTQVVLRSTRHVVATSLTTMAGFIPLLLGGGGFWPPLAVAIAGGVGGATILALYFAPAAYILAMCRGCNQQENELSEPVVFEIDDSRLPEIEPATAASLAHASG